ncbi:hypothetical protein [Streptomyces galilaeus]|uniref:hypothetical protein n=1 Tax=Streptomyces galilaeus TaxID=33899 RepID=UPI0038F6924E
MARPLGCAHTSDRSTTERRGHPQMVIRLGYGPDEPASPRRARWAAPEAGAEGGDPSSR